MQPDRRNDPQALAERIRRGEEISENELINLYTSADHAGVLYYKMLTMVNEQRSLAELPATLKEIIKTRAWQNWRWVGSSFGQNSLEAYLTKPPPNGVGIDLETVKRLLRDDPDAEADYYRETTGQPGRPEKSEILNADNISNYPALSHGTSRDYTLARLKRERPDLFARVRAKEMSPNAAAIAAGWRKRKTTLEQMQWLWWKLSDDEYAEFLEWIKWADGTRP